MANTDEFEMADVWWSHADREPAHGFASSQMADTYDLAVVGGGLCGLSIAFHAARGGLSVVLLEQGRVGSGASGRNGGIVVPQFPGSLRPSQVRRLIGARHGERLIEIVQSGPSFVFDQIRAHQIQCDAEQTGWIQPAHSERALEQIRLVYEEWRALGADCRWLDGAEITQHLGASGYLGGWLSPSGGMVNPLLLTRGIARVACDAGVHIREKSAVAAVGSAPGGQLVTGPGFALTARKVVLATNGYTSGLYPELDRSVIPVRLFHTMTAPLPEALRGNVMPTRTPFTDTRKSGGFSRYDASGRILSGGAVFALARPRSYGRRHAQNRLRTIFPQLGKPEIERYWEGYCAISPDYLPRLQRLGDDVYAVVGFSTRGVSLTQNLGREVAGFLCETVSAQDLPLPIDQPRPIFLHGLKKHVGRVAFPLFQAQDRLGLT